MTEPSLSTADVCRQTGATYRQVDYWTRRGLLEPATAASGPGSRRRWSRAELEAVRRLVSRSADLRRGLDV